MRWLILATAVCWALALVAVIPAVRSRGAIRRIRRLAAGLALGALGALGASGLLIAHLFHAFAGATPVAQVTTRWLGPDEFELTYTPQPAVGGSGPLQVRLRGDQWAISGGVVKWHPWLTALGVPSYHRPMRISGQFSRLATQREHPPTVFPLAAEEGDWVWEALYRLDPFLPFVEAVYGSSAFIYVEPHAVQEISVTVSGYLIKRGTWYNEASQHP